MAYSEFLFLNNRGKLYEYVHGCIDRSERTIGSKLQSLLLDDAGEQKGEIVSFINIIEGVTIERSPPYASSSSNRRESREFYAIIVVECPVHSNQHWTVEIYMGRGYASWEMDDK